MNFLYIDCHGGPKLKLMCLRMAGVDWADGLATHACGRAGGWAGGPRVRAGRDDPKPG
jgi:hypothetical protein